MDNNRVDKETITNLIGIHSPPCKMQAVASTMKKPSNGSPVSTPRRVIPSKKNVMRLSVSPAGTETPTQMIEHNKPFNINIAIIDEGLKLDEGAVRNCTASVQARPIEGGESRTVGQYAGPLSPKRSFAVQAQAGRLSPGFYYLTAQVTVQPKKAGEQPVRFVEEEYAVDVY